MYMARWPYSKLINRTHQTCIAFYKVATCERNRYHLESIYMYRLLAYYREHLFWNCCLRMSGMGIVRSDLWLILDRFQAYSC